MEGSWSGWKFSSFISNSPPFVIPQLLMYLLFLFYFTNRPGRTIHKICSIEISYQNYILICTRTWCHPEIQHLFEWNFEDNRILTRDQLIEELVTNHSAYRSLHQWLFDWISIQIMYWCTRTWYLAVVSVGFGFSTLWYEILPVRWGREAMMIFSNWTRRRWLHCHNVSPFVCQLFEPNKCKPQLNIGPPLIWGLTGFPNGEDWSWANELQWCVV